MTQEQRQKLFGKVSEKIDQLLKSKEGGHICYLTPFAEETLKRDGSAMMFLEAATLRLLACDEVIVDVARYVRDSVCGMTEASVRVSLNKIEHIPNRFKTPPSQEDVELCHMMAEYLQIEAQQIVEKLAVKSS